MNIITRSGGNDLHGTAFYFFRDHKLAAYPALNRDPSDPDPFFQRQQFGFAIGGPIRRNRVFYFGSWERNEQQGVSATTLLTPDFASFSRITNSPLFGDLLSVRLDGKINNAHTAFVRYSHDGSSAFGPAASTIGGGSPNDYPSSWNRVLAWADQSLLGLYKQGVVDLREAIAASTTPHDLRLMIEQYTMEVAAEQVAAGQ